MCGRRETTFEAMQVSTVCYQLCLQEVKSRLKDIMGRLMHPDQTWAAMEELYFLRR